jgi:hypothetical protein
VKLLRLCLLVVLAALLPIRGAMAAAMLCPPAGTSLPAELRASGHEAHHGQAQPDEHSMHHHEGTARHDASPAPDHDQCNLCSAFCSLTPLPSAMPGVPPPLEVSAASFPDVAAPAPSFVCGGQERPPRSI